jgi:LCP family protein required for cell wall assembly
MKLGRRTLHPLAVLGLCVLHGSWLAVWAAGGTVLGWANANAPKLTQAVIHQTIAPVSPQKSFKADRVTVLLLGCDDSFSPDGKLIKTNTRSDMMMLAQIDLANRRISGCSIPRDTLMHLSGEQNRRINQFHALGGEDLSKRAVETLTKVKIDRVAKLDSVQFMEIVNMLGGVEVDSPKDLEYTDRSDGLYIRVKKGRNRLNGYQALGFVRFRHDDDDLARQRRQREFMMAMRDKMKQDPTAALQAVDHLVPLFGGAFTQEELLSLFQFGTSLPGQNIKLTGWPVRPFPGSVEVVTDRSKTAQILADLGITPTLGDPASPAPDAEARP